MSRELIDNLRAVGEGIREPVCFEAADTIERLEQQLYAEKLRCDEYLEDNKHLASELKEEIARNRPLRDLVAALEGQKSILLNHRTKYQEAVATLDSEREANARLTADLTANQKQNKLLREAVEEFLRNPGGDYTEEIANEALAATADLSGLVLCEGEPVAWGGTSGVGEWIVSKSKVWKCLTTPLYRAREQK